MEFRLGFFYGGIGGSIIWLLQIGLGMGLPMGLLVGWGLRHRLLWFGC